MLFVCLHALCDRRYNFQVIETEVSLNNFTLRKGVVYYFLKNKTVKAQCPLQARQTHETPTQGELIFSIEICLFTGGNNNPFGPAWLTG